MRHLEFWNIARDELRAGRAVYLCLVVGQKKGTPGTTASRMLYTEQGVQHGTVGGGIMERRVIDTAIKLLKTKASLSPRLVVKQHRAGVGEQASGLICGGAQTNLEMVLTGSESLRTIEDIADAAAQDCDAGVLFDSTGIQLVAHSNVSVLVDSATQLQGDDWSVFTGLRNSRRIVVYGGGHCGVALSNAMQRLDYAVTLVDPRVDLFTTAELHPAVRRLNVSFESAAEKLGSVGSTIAVVMTYSMVTDVEALSGALRVGFKRIGLMGSPVKIAHIKKELSANRFSDAEIFNIVAPIGLNFNSDTPEEIAVSIAAQILLEREGQI